jgi:hypothetical protein
MLKKILFTVLTVLLLGTAFFFFHFTVLLPLRNAVVRVS